MFSNTLNIMACRRNKLRRSAWICHRRSLQVLRNPFPLRRLPQYGKLYQHDLFSVRENEIQLPTLFHIEPNLVTSLQSNQYLLKA